MKARGNTIKIWFLSFLLSTTIVTGCSNSGSGNDEGVNNKSSNSLENETKKSKTMEKNSSEIKMKNGVFDRNPQNFRTVSEGSNTFFMGERGIYDVSSYDWRMIYQGKNFKGIDIYYNMIYFMQGDNTDTSTSIMRMDYDGGNVEVLLENSGLRAWLRIYDDILYSYEEGTFLIKGYALGKKGEIEKALDISEPDFLYNQENEDTQSGDISSTHSAITRGFSMEYYDGIFETRKIEDSSEILGQEVFFVSEGNEELVVPNFHDSIAIIGNVAYYTKGVLTNSDVYMMGINERVESKFCAGNLAFLNYDKDYIYFTDQKIHPGPNKTELIKKVNLNTQEVKELFSIEVSTVGYKTCFDIMDGWAYYKDYGTGRYVRRNLEDAALVQTEP